MKLTRRTRLAFLALPVLLGAVLALAACGGAGEEAEAGGQAEPAFDRAFIDAMVPHHEEAIAMARAATEAGLDEPELVEIVEAIIATQQEEIDLMLRWRADWYGSGEVDPAGAEALDLTLEEMGMQHAAGDLGEAGDADQAFAAMMVDHHGGAIVMARLALERAEHPELRELAEAIVAAQEAEIDVMRAHAAAMHGDGHEAAAGGIEGTVWVANEEEGSLSVIDAATNRVVATLRGIEGPHNVQASPDGLSAWAVSGHDDAAVRVDAETYEVTGVVSVGDSPAHVVVLPDGSAAYVTNAGDDTVSVIDVGTLEVVATIPVGAYPHGLRPSPDGRLVVLANAGGTTLTVIDTATSTVSAEIEVGKAPVQVAFSPDGAFVYASLRDEDAVAKIDLATGAVVGKVSVGPGPIQVYVSPDGRYVVAANQGTEDAPGTTLSIVDAATFVAVAEVETGLGAHGVVVDPSSRYAYVANLYSDDVAVVDLEERAVVARIPVGDVPNGISFSPLPPASGGAVDLGPMMGEHGEGEMPGMDH